jgi:hypothetical protein
LATIAQATWTSKRTATIRNVTAHLQTRDSILTLQDLTSANAGQQLTGRGQFDLSNKQWWVWLRGAGFALPLGDGSEPAPPLAFDATAWGQGAYAQLRQVYARVGNVEASAFGAYDNHLPKPLQLDLWLRHLTPLGAEEQSSLVRGRLRSETHLAGTVNPLNLELTGRLLARDLVVRGRALGDVRAALEGNITRDFVRARTRGLKLLGGAWDLEFDWPSDYPEKSLQITAAVTDLPLRSGG